MPEKIPRFITRPVSRLRIPRGPYCYRFLGIQRKPWKMKIKACPAWGWRELIPGVDAPYCSHLGMFGEPNGFPEGEYEKLVEHFGTEEKADDAMPLFLLWDMCKECGVNEDHG